MATKFSDIMGNYKDMSVADLGSSLLQRKEEMQREAVKAAKKNARVEKALGLLLAGQTVFKGAFKRRAKELESAYQFQIADNESQSKEINMLAKLTNPMYQWSETVKDKTFANDEEKLDSFVASEFFDPFRISVNNYTEPAFKQMMGDKFESFSNQSAYFNTQVEAAKDYARHYLKDDNYKTATKKLAEIFGMPEKDFDSVKLFKDAMGLKTHELTEIERRNYQTILNNYKDDANIFSGIKQVLQMFGDKEKRKGGIPLFQKIDERVLLGPSLNTMLNSLDFQGLTNTIVNDRLVALNRSTARFDVEFDLPKNKKLRDSLPMRMEELANLVDSKKFSLYNDLSRGGQANIISRSDFDDLFEDMSPIQQQELQRDGGKFSLLLDPRDPRNDQFLKGLFASNHKGDANISFEQFKQKLMNETFRVQYGMTLAASEGYKNVARFEGVGFKDSRYLPETGEIVSTIYDRYSGNLPMLLNEGIIYDEKSRGYKMGEGWNKMSKEIQLKDFNATLAKIQTKPISEKAKEVEIMNLFEAIPNPLNLNVNDYIKSEQYQDYVAKAAGDTGEGTPDIEIETITRGSGRRKQEFNYVKNYQDVTSKINLETLSNDQLRFIATMSNQDIKDALGTSADLTRGVFAINPLSNRATQILAQRIRDGKSPVISELNPVKPDEFFRQLIRQL